MPIQEKFFKEKGFEEIEINYEYGIEKCYKAANGAYYRIDHFSHFYVIECAENKEEANLGRFEDADLFDDSLSESEILEQITKWFKEHA